MTRCLVGAVASTRPAAKFTPMIPPVMAIPLSWSSVRLRWCARSAHADESVATTGPRAWAVSESWLFELVARYKAEGEAAFEPQAIHPRPRKLLAKQVSRPCQPSSIGSSDGSLSEQVMSPSHPGLGIGVARPQNRRCARRG